MKRTPLSKLLAVLALSNRSFASIADDLIMMTTPFIIAMIATLMTRVVADPHFMEVDGISEIPRVGLSALQACTASTADEACTQNVDMVEALDADYYVTVTGFEKGVLNCDSLDLAEDAPQLRFNLTNSEEVTARKKSLQVFSDNASRMVWTGEVVETGYAFGNISRSIAMSWSGCDVEKFKLRAITLRHDGTTRETVTLPCTDASEANQVCLLQIDHAPEEEVLETSIVDGHEDGSVRRRNLRETNSTSKSSRWGYAAGTMTAIPRTRSSKRAQGRRRLAREVSEGARVRDPDAEDKSEDVRLLNKYLGAGPAEKEAFHERGVRRLSSEEVQMPSGRILAASTIIDVMVVYTEASMIRSNKARGTLMTTSQMDATIGLSYATVNDAFKDSGIEASINIVHTAKVAFIEGPDMNDDLSSIAKGGEFDDLRTEKGADLVQLIGFYGDGCGSGYIMEDQETFDKWAYSIVHVDCLAGLSHIHEIGHNLGALHDRESADTDHSFAHAYCDDIAPYRTIMAYDTSCIGAVRVPRFSTPSTKYLQTTLGTATANNARKIQENVPWVVNFRGGSQSSSGASGTSVSAADASTPVAVLPSQQQQHERQQQQKHQQQQKQQQRGTTTPISAADARSDRTYQGCYRHSFAELELANNPIVHFSNTSRESCREHCVADFAYYALEFGFICSCGSSLPDESRMTTKSDCSLPCTSLSTDLSCGGNWHWAVFSVDANDEVGGRG